MAGRNFFPASFGLLLALQLQVVEKLEEHDPRQQRQAVEVAVQPLVLPHDVAGGLEQTAEGLGSSLRCGRCFFGFGHYL